jgi:HAD superfamily hydrolase (TIGR01662 family)
MIEAVIFDLYGTLITSEEGLEPRDEALSRISRAAGHEAYYQEVWSACQFVSFIDYPKGRANTRHEYYAKVLERLEIPATQTLRDKLAAKDLELEKTVLYPDVAPIVNALKRRGIKTSIVTTIASWRFKPLLEQNNIEIDYVCTAKESQAVKPNPKSFVVVLNKFRTQAQQAMMVGDDVRTDIEPAKELGMKTVLLCRGEKAECKTADHVISSLSELPNLL